MQAACRTSGVVILVAPPTSPRDVWMLSKKRLKGKGFFTFLLMVPMYFTAGMIPSFLRPEEHCLHHYCHIAGDGFHQQMPEGDDTGRTQDDQHQDNDHITVTIRRSVTSSISWQSISTKKVWAPGNIPKVPRWACSSRSR